MFQDIQEIESWLYQHTSTRHAIRVRAMMWRREGDEYQVWLDLADKLSNQPDLVSAMLRHVHWRVNFRGTMIAWLHHQTHHYEDDFILRLKQGMGFGPQTMAAGWAVLTRPEFIPSMESILIEAMQAPLDVNWSYNLLSVYAALLHHNSTTADEFEKSPLFEPLMQAGHYNSVEITQSYIDVMLPLP